MPILTINDLQALTGQMDRERELYSRYLAAMEQTQDQHMKEQFQDYAQQHLQNYTELLDHLC